MPGHVKPIKKSEHHALKLARFQLMAKAQLINLGAAIRERRDGLGLSRTHLAARFPVDPKTIERWEGGKNPGAFDNLDEVARHLETTPQALQARAIEIARENDSGASPDEPNEDRPVTLSELKAAEKRAEARHAQLLGAIASLRNPPELEQEQGQQEQRKQGGR